MKEAKFRSLLLCLLLIGCGPSGGDTARPITAMALENGPPVSLKLGDHVLVEGRIGETSNGYFILENTTGVGRMADRNCFLLTGLESVWRPRHWKMKILASTGTIAAVTGVATKRFAVFPTPGGGQHQSRMCLAALEADNVSAARW